MSQKSFPLSNKNNTGNVRPRNSVKIILESCSAEVTLCKLISVVKTGGGGGGGGLNIRHEIKCKISLGRNALKLLRQKLPLTLLVLLF